MSRRALVLVLPLAAVGATGCEADAQTPTTTDSPAAWLLQPAAFAEMIRKPSVTAVNVHTPYEGEIPGTDVFVPFDRIRDERERLPADTATLIAVYCRSGRMSSDAARTLAGLGYANVVDLQGGMDAWEASGRSVEHDAGG